MMKKNMGQGKFPQRGPNALWMLLLVVGLGIAYLFWYNSINFEIESISFSKMLKAAQSGHVESVKIQGQHVQGVYKDGKKFETYMAPTTKFWDVLDQKNVDIKVYPVERDSWGSYLFLFLLLPFLIAMLVMYMRQSQGGSGGPGKIFSVGKSKARMFKPSEISVTFKDVAGVQEAKEDLKDIVEFLKTPEKYERLGAKIPRGVLLSGAPGNGKTMLAKAVAGEASCPFFSISGSDFVEVFVGVGASRVRDLFAQAKKHSPCIVFIDEIDAVGRQRGIGLGGGNDEREQTLNQLLAEMDGFGTEHGAVIVIAATNRPDVLDKALLRPGRFDRQVDVPYPDLTSREQILVVHSKKIKLDEEVDLKKIARGTPGFSGADLENILNEAALLASKGDDKTVKMKHFERARDKIILGAERKTLIFTPKEKEMTAYHEAGHALLNLLQPDSTDPFHKVTIVPRGRTLGVSWSLPERDKHSHTKTEMKARMIVAFGGYLAETLVYNDQTSGCSSDIENATNIARAMVKSYGMSDLGPIDFNKSKKFSQATSQRIDQEVEKIVNECYEKGKSLLSENRDKLDLLANTLVEKETLQAKDVYELLDITPREMHRFDE